MSDKAARFERRLQERRERQQNEKLEEVQAVPPVERRSGEDRRVRSMTSAEVDDWLKRNGVSGGDRRKGSRRK